MAHIKHRVPRLWRMLAISLAVAACAGIPTSSLRVAQSTAPKAGFLRFQKLSIQDRPDMIGGEAFSILAPAGWKMEGGMVWRLHPTMPAAVSMRIFNPQGAEQLSAFPTQGYSWGGILAWTGFPEGSNYMGNEVRPPIGDPFVYIRQYLVPRHRSGIRMREVSHEALPELAKAVKAQNPDQGGLTSKVSAGKIRFEYEADGKTYEEDMYCALLVVLLPGANMYIWMADQLGAMRAEKGRLDEAEKKYFNTMVRSVRLNPQWFNRYAQLVQALIRYQNRQIENAGVISRIISQTSAEISESRTRDYERRQAGYDRVNDSYSQYIRGVDEYRNPNDGASVELPSGYGHAWRGLNDQYIVTDSANFNPNVELDGAWTPLEKTP